MKNTLERFNSRADDPEERISKLDKRLEVITQAEQLKQKVIQKKENSLRELWGNIKHMNIHIIGVPEGEKKDKGAENLSEEIIAENLPNQRKETEIQVQ